MQRPTVRAEVGWKFLLLLSIQLFGNFYYFRLSNLNSARHELLTLHFCFGLKCSVEAVESLPTLSQCRFFHSCHENSSTY